MILSNYSQYINNIAQSPSDTYNSITQETIKKQWDNTTQLRTVQEENYPFNQEYTEYEAWISTISNVSVNTDKIIGDYIGILFKDCDHPQNYKGQKYIYNNDTYLCYDRLNKLTQVSDFKCIRCNNVMSWIDRNSKNIYTEPMFLGYEVSSTNNQISKEGTIGNSRLIIFCQANEKTKSISINQRFIFQHKSAFKVEEINNYNQESGTNGDVTFLKFHMVKDTINPQTDNIELNLADYNNIMNGDTTDTPSEIMSEIIISPTFSNLVVGDSLTFSANLYENSVLADDVVTCVVSGLDNSYYTLVEEIEKNTFTLTCDKESLTKLVLTFSADDGLVEKVIEVGLRGDF